jgi:hypothetical protein
MHRQQFQDFLNDPITEQHQRYFRKYFGSDISTKTFTIDEFCRLFQLKSTLGIFHFSFNILTDFLFLLQVDDC